MKILAYNDVDPMEVLQLNLLGRDAVFSPESVAALRRADPRVFPWLTLNALERGSVAGQVGAFRLPVVSTEGESQVGGVWGFVVRPDVRRREVCVALLEELHARMRAEGIRFSVVFIDPQSTGRRVFARHGYRELHSPGSAFARWQTAYQPTRLSAGLAGPAGYERVEFLFSEIAGESLGFSRRPAPFPPLRAVNPGHLWMFGQAGEAAGYALAHTDRSVLKVSHLLLKAGVNVAEAVAALTANLRASFVHVEINHPTEYSDLQRGGYRLNRRANGILLICPLYPGLTVKDAQQLFGVTTGQFMFSRLDVVGP